jgi:hypothetical protein
MHMAEDNEDEEVSAEPAEEWITLSYQSIR